MSQSKSPVLSILAICCPLLIRGIFYFLATATGRNFNEQVFGRYYTLGMLLMLGFYAAIVLGLVGVGLALGVLAWRRRETPAWLPWLALAANIIAPFAVLLSLTHQGQTFVESTLMKTVEQTLMIGAFGGVIVTLLTVRKRPVSLGQRSSKAYRIDEILLPASLPMQPTWLQYLFVQK